MSSAKDSNRWDTSGTTHLPQRYTTSDTHVRASSLFCSVFFLKGGNDAIVLTISMDDMAVAGNLMHAIDRNLGISRYLI
jgi:hypothetical protein